MSHYRSKSFIADSYDAADARPYTRSTLSSAAKQNHRDIEVYRDFFDPSVNKKFTRFSADELTNKKVLSCRESINYCRVRFQSGPSAESADAYLSAAMRLFVLQLNVELISYRDLVKSQGSDNAKLAKWQKSTLQKYQNKVKALEASLQKSLLKSPRSKFCPHCTPDKRHAKSDCNELDNLNKKTKVGESIVRNLPKFTALSTNSTQSDLSSKVSIGKYQTYQSEDMLIKFSGVFEKLQRLVIARASRSIELTRSFCLSRSKPGYHLSSRPHNQTLFSERASQRPSHAAAIRKLNVVRPCNCQRFLARNEVTAFNFSILKKYCSVKELSSQPRFEISVSSEASGKDSTERYPYSGQGSSKIKNQQKDKKQWGNSHRNVIYQCPFDHDTVAAEIDLEEFNILYQKVVIPRWLEKA